MDPRFFAHRDELHNVQMELRQVKNVQDHHAERLLRVEKRQQDDAALKSVWSSPFPTALGGTPQHGPTHLPATEDFDLSADVPTHALGSLHLEPDDEPARRGAASRANSVRFDESANWGANTRHSGDFGLSRPSSGLAMMERSLSHKSDGRHSSAGHSVHSVHSVHSTHSVASGRGSSLALDTFMGREEDSPVEIPDPPPSSFYLEPAPALVRCWLTNDFVSNSVLYAALCSGAQKSLLEHSLIQELGLSEQVFRDADGVHRINLSVYLTEAMVAQASSRSPNPVPQMPSLTARFEVMGIRQGGGEETQTHKRIRIFLGSDVLRTHNVDLLFSQNLMMLYTNNREKLTVPFARPDDETLFRNLATTVVLPEKPKLNAAAAEFVSAEPKSQDAAEFTEAAQDTETAKPQATAVDDDADAAEKPVARALEDDVESLGPLSPTTDHATQTSNWVKSTQAQAHARGSENGDLEKAPRQSISSDHSGKEGGPADAGARRDSGAIWGSWRQGGPPSGDSNRENGLSGYRPAGQGRTMKVLKTSKTSTSTSTNRESAPAPRSGGELRRKSQAHGNENGTGSSSSRVIHWERKNGNNAAANSSASGGLGSKDLSKSTAGNPDTIRNVSNPFPRSANPVGGASAFAWMKPEKPKAATTGAN